MKLAMLSLFAALPLCAPQDKSKTAPPDNKVAEAIKKGVEWLKERKNGLGGGRDCMRELVLLTMVHAGLRPGDEPFDELFSRMLDEKPEFTYRTALRAMVLEEVQRVKYQHLLYHCAQFLVDNQSANGFWGYGEPTELKDVPPAKEATASGGKPAVKILDGSGPKEKPKPVRTLKVTKQRDGQESDNSNSQYAALGLRACHDAGIIIPEETIERAVKWWRKCQQNQADKTAPVATSGGVPGKPRGWDYKDGNSPYGSMTAGAVGALAIFLYMQNRNWKRDQDLADGAAWLGAHFSVTQNPKKGGEWHYYYLYGLERAGVLYDAERFGSHSWYPEGAWYLLDNQKKEDGSWGGDVKNTCFAILFLKRATRPLVETVGGGRNK
jgi:hypothetical protein